MNNELRIGKQLDFLKRNKRTLVMASLSLFALFSVGAVGVGYMAVKAIGYTAERVQNSEVAKVITQVDVPNVGFFEEMVRSVASGWLEQKLNSAELVSFKSGLACFDAVGGPSPQHLVNYMKARISDPHILKKLDEVNSAFVDDKNAPNGPAACANWMFNS